MDGHSYFNKPNIRKYIKGTSKGRAQIKKSKSHIVFRCSSCDHEEPKWLGRCPECGSWNTLVEAAVQSLPSAPFLRGAGDRAVPKSMPLEAVDTNEGVRIGSGCAEFDRVLGGGIMRRSATLVGGEPGIGKSTLLLQIASSVQSRGRVLYVSGEESAGQVKMRAQRLSLDCKNIEIFCSGHTDEIQNVLEVIKPVIIIIDSVQTLYTPLAGIVPGTVNQLKFCCFELINWVKEHDASMFLVAHVTKEGIIAGPKTIEHMVDTVLYFEQSDGECRFLRASKNRFGSVDEIGLWTMGEGGLLAVDDPSLLFLVRREGALPAGIATAAVLEGSRTLLVEIQALCVPAKGSASRIYSDKIDASRVARVAATLEKSIGLRFADHDIYVNVAGGIRIVEVGVELSIAAALYSSRTGLPLPEKVVLAGELSLAAEVLPVRRLAARIKTALGLGFKRFICPKEGDLGEGAGDIKKDSCIAVKDLKAAIAALYEKA